MDLKPVSPEQEQLDELLAQWFDASVKPTPLDLCPNNPALCGKLEALIRQYEAAEAFRQGESAAEAVTPEMWPKVPNHELLELVGRGGMGTVFKGRQLSTGRVVAVKVLPAATGSIDMLRRFRQEVTLASQFKHPGIVPIFEAGNARGPLGPMPFYSMEFVDGLRLDEYVRTHSPDMEKRVQMLIETCDAVAAVHALGWVHRDIKPSNIMVATDGKPRLLDFGVARAVGSAAGVETMHTATGEFVGTRQYTSPEQMRGGANSVGVRSDVYALGVVAYEVLAGRRPYEVDRLSPEQALRTICEEDPSAPTTAGHRVTDELQTIVLTAMAKDPLRRYADATAMRDDLLRCQSGQRIIAKKNSTWYRLRVFSRRNKVLVSTVAGVIVALAIGLGIALQQKVRADALARHARWQLADQLSRTGIELADEGDPTTGLLFLARAIQLVEDDALRNRHARIRFATTLEQVPTRAHDDDPTWESGGLAFDPRVQIIRNPSRPSERVRVTLPGQPPFEYEHAGRIWWWEISRDGRYLASAGNRQAYLYQLPAGRLIRRLDEPQEHYWVATFSPDGRRLAVAGYEQQLIILDTSSGSSTMTTAEGIRGCVTGAWSADGGTLALGNENGDVGLIDAATGRRTLLTGQWPRLFCLAFSPDGSKLIAGTEGGEVTCLDPATGHQVGITLRHSDAIGRVMMNQRGVVVSTVVGRGYRAERLHGETFAWSGFGRGAIRELARPDVTGVAAVVLDDDARSAIVVSITGAAKVDLANGRTTYATRFEDLQMAKAIAPLSLNTGFVILRREQTIRIFDLRTGELLPRPMSYARISNQERVSPDRSRLLISSGPTPHGDPLAVQLFDIASGRTVGQPIVRPDSRDAHLSFSPNSRYFAIGGDDHVCRVYDAVTGQAVAADIRHDEALFRVVFMPDSARLLTASYDGHVKISDLSGRELTSLDCATRLLGLAMSPDGTALVTTSVDGSGRIWDLRSRAAVGAIMRVQMPAYPVGFSSDGSIVRVKELEKGRSQLWSVTDGLPLSPLLYCSDDAVFHPREDSLICYRDGLLGAIDFKPAVETAEELMRTAQGLSGFRLDETNSPVKLK
jgi:WD40 repeat protein